MSGGDSKREQVSKRETEDSFRASLVRLSLLDPALQCGLLVTVGVIVLVSGVLVWFGTSIELQSQPHEGVSASVNGLGVVHAVELACLASAWGFVLSTGVLLDHHLRWLAVVGFAVIPAFQLWPSSVFGLIAGMPWALAAAAAIVLLAPVWRRKRVTDRIRGTEWRFKIAIWLGFTILASASLAVTSLLPRRGFVSGAAGTGAFLVELAALQIVVLPILLVAGSDWAELGVAIFQSLIRFVSTGRSMLVVDLAAASVAVYELNDVNSAGLVLSDVPLLGWEVLMAATVVGIWLWLARAGRARRRAKVPYRAALAGGIVTVGVAIAATTLRIGLVQDVSTTAEWLVGLICLVFTIWLVIALPRLAGRPGGLSSTWLVLAAVAIVYVVDAADAIRASVGILGPQLPTALLQGLSILAATATLLALIVAARGGRNAQACRAVTRPLLCFMTVLVLLGFVSQGYASGEEMLTALRLPRLGQPAVTALLLVVALGWELATCGASVLNKDGRTMTRPVRGNLFFAYIITVAAVILFEATLSTELGLNEELLIDLHFKPDQFVQDGIRLLGVPVLIFVTLAQLRWTWISHPDPRLRKVATRA